MRKTNIDVWPVVYPNIWIKKGPLKTEEGADIDGYIKRLDNGKKNSDEEIDIEEIVNRPEFQKKERKPKIVPVTHKEAI